MNRDQKAAAVAEIAAHIDDSQAIFAVDYRGLSVPEAAELRSKLREADATFKVVKNSLTERAADQAGAQTLKDLLAGPTALTFVRGDIAVAAKAIADQARATQLLPFKGGLMDGDVLDAEQIRALSRLPSRDTLYGQLVGVVASPVSGLVRTLAAMLGGIAVALGQVRDKKQSGELPAGEPPASDAPADRPLPPDGEAPEAQASPAGVEPTAATQAPSQEAPEQPPAGQSAEAASSEVPPETQDASPAGEASAESLPAAEQQAEPRPDDATPDDQSEAADASAQAQPDVTDADPTKED
jgi:large subunit ribosomal protein L10